MPKKTKKIQEPQCSKCGKVVDREAVLSAIARGLRYEHPCGRVLSRGTMP